MRNILLNLKYDGYEFSGWQKQPEKRTVQGALESELNLILDEVVELKGCSRTDSGVHALDYYAVFKTASNIPVKVIPSLLNRRLIGVEVISAYEVHLDFNPRYRAYKKTYEYIISPSSDYDVFSSRYKWFVDELLDFQKMNRAAQLIVGKHDFRAFRKTSRDDVEKDTIREIFDISVSKKGNDILVSVTGDGFLYNMVRIIVGSLYEIGTYKRDENVLLEAFEKGDRSILGITAPARGLYLKRVYF